MIKRNPHAPAHLFVDDTFYFVTGAIYQKRPLLADPELKRKLLELFKEYFQKYDWELHHWVILDNHYHLMGYSRKGKELSHIFRSVHSRSGIMISQATHCAKPVWWNYWDYCPRNEKDYFIRLNYLLTNPIKHGYVSNLHDYPFSSFHPTLAEIGREDLVKQIRDYPDYKTLVLHEAKEDDF
jgi:putative transposase